MTYIKVCFRIYRAPLCSYVSAINKVALDRYTSEQFGIIVQFVI